MGKQILIIALGMAIIISFLVIKLNANTSQSEDATVNFYEKQQSRVIANSGVEVYLEKLRRNKSLKGTFLNNKLMDGSYDIYIYGPDSLMKIKSVGRYGDAVHTTLVTAMRDPVSMPSVNSALYISSNSMSMNLNGNLDINGNDTNIDGSAGPMPALPGIGVDDTGDSAFVVNNIKPKISNDIKGEGGPPSVRHVDDLTDWEALTDNIIFAADTTIPTGTYSSGTVLGTLAKPKISYIDGDVHFSGTATGSGIMVVNGNLTMSGNFTFYGIIIAYDKSTIETDVVGNGGVYGGTILVGQKVDIHATGNASFYYSSEAIKNAKLNLKSSRFAIVSWWE